MQKKDTYHSNVGAASKLESDQFLSTAITEGEFDAIGRGSVSLLRRVDPLFDTLVGALGAVAGGLLLLMTIIICYGVIMRYIVAKPPVWVNEITEYILLFTTFLGAAWVLKEDGHVKIDILLEHLSRKNKRILNIVNSIIGSVVCLFFVWYGIIAVYSLYSRKVIMLKMLPIPKYILLAVIPLGILVTLIQFLRLTNAYLRGESPIQKD